MDVLLRRPNVHGWCSPSAAQTNPLRSVDVFIDEPIGFDDLMAESVVKEMDGLKVRIASIPHLIEMKRRAGRPRDLEDIDKLQQIHDAGQGGAR